MEAQAFPGLRWAGHIPRSAGSKPNWSTPGLNHFFGQNKQSDSEFGAPDAVVAIEGVTTKTLYPLESEVIALPFDAAPTFRAGVHSRAGSRGYIHAMSRVQPTAAASYRRP